MDKLNKMFYDSDVYRIVEFEKPKATFIPAYNYMKVHKLVTDKDCLTEQILNERLLDMFKVIADDRYQSTAEELLEFQTTKSFFPPRTTPGFKLEIDESDYTYKGDDKEPNFSIYDSIERGDPNPELAKIIDETIPKLDNEFTITFDKKYYRPNEDHSNFVKLLDHLSVVVKRLDKYKTNQQLRRIQRKYNRK